MSHSDEKEVEKIMNELLPVFNLFTGFYTMRQKIQTNSNKDNEKILLMNFTRMALCRATDMCKIAINKLWTFFLKNQGIDEERRKNFFFDMTGQHMNEEVQEIFKKARRSQQQHDMMKAHLQVAKTAGGNQASASAASASDSKGKSGKKKKSS